MVILKKTETVVNFMRSRVYSSVVRSTKKVYGEDRAEEGEEGGEKTQGSGVQCAAQYDG